VVGAYCIIRGISMVCGGYPNEILIYYELDNDSYYPMPTMFYVYTLLYIIIAIFGFYVQE